MLRSNVVAGVTGVKNFLLMSSVGFMGLTAVSVGTWYYSGGEQRAAEQAIAVAKAAEVEQYKRDKEPHRLVLIGYVYPVVKGRQSNSVPVMVKMVVEGSKRLKALCGRMPHVKEAVLRTFSPNGIAAVDESGRLDLAKYEPYLQRAINEAVTVNAVGSLSAVPLNAAAGGLGPRGTLAKCREVLRS